VLDDALREGRPDPREIPKFFVAGSVGVYAEGFIDHEALLEGGPAR
jgi:hypothetical protein